VLPSDVALVLFDSGVMSALGHAIEFLRDIVEAPSME
jgi:hypothetical protein